MHQEKYSLEWKSYSEHLKSMMKEMMMNEDFSDVTLVTDDKKYILANINILSICSPFFKETLKKEFNSRNVMYLRGIYFSELESIIQFIYLGETTFDEERMHEFLAVGKLLEIKGLCTTEDYMAVSLETETKNEHTEDEDPPTNDLEISPDKMNEQTPSKKSQYEKKEIIEKESESSVYQCEQCQKTFSSKYGLYGHGRSVHEGVKYACDQCGYLATKQNHLTRHIQSRHEGVRFTCDQCDHHSTTKWNLTLHIKAKHDGVKYA